MREKKWEEREPLFQFVWQVSTGGYRIVKDGSEQKLTDSVPFGMRLKVRNYQPFDEYTGLFRTFADLAATDTAVCDFANRFGFLSNDLGTVSLPQGDRRLGGYAEPTRIWFQHIDRMKRAVNLYDLALSRDIEALKKVIRWEGREAVFYEHDHGGSVFANNANAQHFSHFVPGDLLQPAMSAVQRIVNKELNSHVAPGLLWQQNWRRLGLYFVPSNLIGAMWLQFANAINRNTPFRHCEYCQTWFEVAPRINRADRRYCSDSCRTKAYRKRKEETVKPAKKKSRKKR